MLSRHLIIYLIVEPDWTWTDRGYSTSRSNYPLPSSEWLKVEKGKKPTEKANKSNNAHSHVDVSDLSPSRTRAKCPVLQLNSGYQD